MIHKRSKYKPEYCDKLIEHMSQGYSFKSFAAVVNVNKDTIFEWQKKFPEFREAHDIGYAHALKFYEDLGIMGITEGKSFNAPTWIFTMKNRFGWRDKTETDVTGQIDVVFHSSLKQLEYKDATPALPATSESN